MRQGVLRAALKEALKKAEKRPGISIHDPFCQIIHDKASGKIKITEIPNLVIKYYQKRMLAESPIGDNFLNAREAPLEALLFAVPIQCCEG